MLPCMFVNRGTSKGSIKKHGLEKLRVSNVFFPPGFSLLSYFILPYLRPIIFFKRSGVFK